MAEWLRKPRNLAILVIVIIVIIVILWYLLR